MYSSEAKGRTEASGDNLLAVLEDVDTGLEYYLDIVDQFRLNGREYVALIPYMDKRDPRDPEFVLLRLLSGDGQNESTLYESIRDKQELQAVFDYFFSRYEQSTSV